MTAARRKPAKKAVAKRTRKPAAQLPAVLQVVVRADHRYGFIAEAKGDHAVCGYDAAPAVRRLADKLGYSKHADVCFRGVDPDQASRQHFDIVEVARAKAAN